MNPFETRKEQILKSIAELFYQKGYEKTSIRDISTSLGITVSGVYYYFKNKQEILFTIIDGVMQKAIANFQEKIEVIINPEDKLFQIIYTHIKFYEEYKAETRVLIKEGGFLEGEYAKIFKDQNIVYLNHLKKVLEEIKGGSESEMDVGVAAFCLVGILNWMTHWYNPKGKISPEILAENISRILLKGLRAIPSNSYRGR